LSVLSVILRSTVRLRRGFPSPRPAGVFTREHIKTPVQAVLPAAISAALRFYLPVRAGLAARGVTEVNRRCHIDRSCGHIGEKLRMIGAVMRRERA
jgi:hypothetical protein